MFTKDALSTQFAKLSSHVSGIREDIRLIKREHNMLDLEKIVPLHEFSFAFFNNFENIGIPSTHLQKVYLRHHRSMIKRMLKQSRNHQINYYVSTADLLTQESEQMHKLMNDLSANIPNVKATDYCLFFHLGDLLNATEHAIGDKNLWYTTRISAAKGGGKTDLQIWKTINAMKDYSDKFTDNKPTRRRKKREFKAGALKWSPKFA